MEALIHSYSEKDNFPINLISPGIYPYRLEEYKQRLADDAHRLFSSESRAAVDFLEFDEAQKGE
jgi:hypothetical protein